MFAAKRVCPTSCGAKGWDGEDRRDLPHLSFLLMLTGWLDFCPVTHVCIAQYFTQVGVELI